MMKRLRPRPLLSFLSLLAALGAPALALAQEFQKVEGAPKQEVPAVPFVGIAYGFIWVAILVYVFFVARGVANVRGEISELRRKLDAASRKE
jgi:CcmD family protein